MRKFIFALLLLTFGAIQLSAQKYFTREGKISFLSEAPLETIEAQNHKATSVLDTETGRMEFAVLIKAFQFEKALMQEHFNENYLESDQYPKATFKGEIINLKEVDFGKDGTYVAQVKGELTIHGVTKEVETSGTLNVKGQVIDATAEFEVVLEDYKVEIPAVVKDNISKTVAITVDIGYQPLNR